jgi:hypothetical protein
VAALGDYGVTCVRERQSLARLADAWLELPDREGEDLWFAKAPALAQLLAISADHERDLPIPGAWDDIRIAGVVERARDWLARRIG